MGHLKDTEFATENRRRKRINGAQCQSSVGCSSERQGCLESEGMCSRGMRPNGNTMTSLNERIRRDNRSESKSSTNSVVVNDGHAADCDDEQHPFHESSSQRCMRQQNAQTLQDLYNQEEYIDDDDEDDDSDWEPLQKHADRKKWFCTNCTMANYDDVVHCNVCGEYKESEILRIGFFASQLAPGGYSHVQSELINRHEVGFDERMLLHSEVDMKSRPHPERPDRLRAIAASLATSGIFPGKCFPILAREITKEELQMVHSLEHIEAVEFTSSMLSSYFTQDTYANEHSACAARLAAGLCADLASAIMSGQTKNGFALVRPPGHHAGIKQAMGFCLHNNAAVAALAAQAAGAKKVLIVDWDVHHGNGTQEIFEGNRTVLYISLHRHEEGLFYPGTGAVNEVGIMGAEGYCVNIPWKCGGVGDNDYIFAFRHVVLPIALEFAPDLTIISAGFDAARGDPLGCCDVTPAGFAQMTHMLTGLSHGKLLVILEGGYNLRSISSSATAVVKVLLGEGPRYELDDKPSKHCLRTILEVMKVQIKYWPILESSYSVLLLQGKALSFQIRKSKIKKMKRIYIPIWWKWGRKKSIYHLFYGGLGLKAKGSAKRIGT
ncbi:Histone deacetylase superfamily [Cinnamomum micranthum f. kanehirae]|uniref:histone deacetylase n=1 Tax=Cinnamomum micranthum f. kanehirae TaxID=337451 RepID=A0A3S3NAY2_9MAGN|nr:Histone deacetylase superfamily [Cinnamomum micranthum f. kanehirae]